MPLVKRSKKTTLLQYEIMLDFLQNHPEMISGKLTRSFTARRREELWKDLTTLLNSAERGPQKTPQKWRRTWVDIKSETKQKVAELKELSVLNLNPPPLPFHLEKIKSLVEFSNEICKQSFIKNNNADQCSIKIKECFTEEIQDTDVLNNETLELNNEANSTVKIENVTDILSAPENTCCEKVFDIATTSSETPCEQMSNILTAPVETPCENISNILSTSENVPCEKVSDIPVTCPETPSEKVLDASVTPEIPCDQSSVILSRSTKTPCEKVCDILTTSVKKLNEVIKNSENRTITAFNALTKATVRANELHERQLQIEEERNKLYRERNEILFTIVNTFIEKKVNHQH